MIFKISDKYKKISWPLVLIVLMDCFGTRSEIIVAMAMAIIILMIFTGKRIVLPKISGSKIYMISILIMFIYGLFFFDQSKTPKGIFHILSSVVVIVLGYYICYVREEKSLVLTSEVLMIILLVYLIVSNIRNISSISGLDEIREFFGGSASTFLFLLLIVLTERIIYQRVIIEKRVDIAIIVVGIIRIIISLNRSTIIAFLAGLTFISIFSLAYKNQKVIMRTILLVVASSIIISLSFAFLPGESLNEFFDKVDKSSSELNSSQRFSNDSNILKNWRGYEIKKAQKQWKNYNGLEMLIGGGIQKYTKMEDMPQDMASMQESIQNEESPILHNGYYTLLIKGGLLAVVGYIIFLAYPMWAFLFKAESLYDKRILIIITGLNVAMAVLTYVVRGLVSQNVITTYALSIGWLYCRYHNPIENNKEDLEQIGE